MKEKPVILKGSEESKLFYRTTVKINLKTGSLEIVKRGMFRGNKLSLTRKLKSEMDL